MNLKRLLTLAIIFSLITFVACDEDSSSTEPETAAAQAAIEAEMTAMDEMVTEVAGGPMLNAMLQFQAISGEFFGEGFFPLAPQVFPDNRLNKFSGLGRFSDIKLDTGLVAIFTMLDLLEGTHTYNPSDSSWSHSDQPEGQVIFVYPFVGTSGEQEARITISNKNLEDTEASLDMSILIDGATVMTMELTVNGSNFLSPMGESSITTVGIEGTIVGQSGTTADYSINITDTSVIMNIGAAGLSGLTVTAEGSGFMSMDLTGEDDLTSNVEQVTIAVGANIEFVITDTEADSGKVGEVYYQGNDVGDLVAEDDELYVQYEGGNKVKLADMMPNTFSLVSLLGGIAL